MKTAYISFASSITDKTVQALISAITDQIAKRVEHIYLMISSDGGATTPGYYLYNFLVGLPIQLTIHVLSNVSSMGTGILMAGKRRIAVPEAYFMFHSVGSYSYERIDLRSVKELNLPLEFITKQKTAALQRTTKLTKQEIVDLIEGGPRYLDTKWALDKGVIHEVRELQIPLGATIIQPNF